jgi:hypothetical protein
MDRIDKRITEKLLLFFYLKEPIEWKNKLTWWYKLSCLMPLALGLYIKIYINTLKTYGQNYPWDVLCWIIILNTPMCYMGDVVTFGYHSYWKTIDVITSMIIVCLYLSVIPLSWTSFMNFNYSTQILFTLVSLFSLHFKNKSSTELKKGIINPSHCEKKYIIYHSVWHYSMCLGNIVVIYLSC